MTGMSFRRGFWIAALLLMTNACVPKQRFEDQEAKLRESQERLRSAEQAAQACDPNVMIQMKEQSQSLDLLTQELVDRNTELSKEVARLRSVETSAKSQEQECGQKLNQMEKDSEAKIERTRRTYEDLIKELRAQIAKLEAAAQAPAPVPAKPAKAASPKAAEKPKKP